MISDAVERYITSVRAAGYIFRKDARRLANYAAFAQARGDSLVNTQSVLESARRSSSALQRRRLVLFVRRFALAMAMEDPLARGTFGGHTASCAPGTAQTLYLLI